MQDRAIQQAKGILAHDFRELKHDIKHYVPEMWVNAMLQQLEIAENALEQILNTQKELNPQKF